MSGPAAARAWALEAVRREWLPLCRDARDTLAARKAAALPVTLGCLCLALAFQLWQDSGPGGHAMVHRLGGISAGLPWWEALARTPLSLFVPAADLPLWGALVQVLVLFGLAEATVGSAPTLAVAYLGTLAGTWYARLGIALGPGFPVLGLPADTAAIHDTGPSAAVVALVAYVAWCYRAWLTCVLVVLAMAAEYALMPNLAAREHLAAVGLVLVLCALRVLRPPRGLRPAPRPRAAPG
ncbi:hypothetical protein [Streptomyces axinellae]|uniref:Integral membrane protein n=1 Tax=Streptomyces axinellae TaxID=552788 RepID=A0ABN3PSJ4_9ACTN